MSDPQETNEAADGQSRAGEAGANLTAVLAVKTTIKVEPGSDMHLTLMMAKYSLNFIVGKDRQDLLAWGRDIWNAAMTANVQN